jgi:biopolymer transport protein TolQ
MIALSILALALLQQDNAVDPSTAAAIPVNPAPIAQQGSALAEIFHNSGPVAMGVLVLLAILSLFSWTIIIAKSRAFASARGQSAKFIRAFRKSGRLSEVAAVSEQFRPSPLVAVFNEINDEYQRQSSGRGFPRNPVGLERAAATASSEALTLMETRLTWLATIANVAPFIGLFGTVWGIIEAFHGLGTAGAATLRAVAPGISEALITTAAGIFVAVPAVVGYNQLTSQLRDFAARMDDFGRELLNAIENAAAYQPPAQPPVQPASADRGNTPVPGSEPRRRVF